MALVQEKKGGPYTKDEREKRQKEVFKLNIEYGYSATKISELMKINRNTINKDVSFLFSKLSDEMDRESTDDWLNKQFARLESQRARLRKELDNDITLKERLHVEKMILDIDSKISYLLMKMQSTRSYALEVGVHFVNRWLEKQGHPERFMSKDNKYRISEEAKEKIFKLLSK